MEGKMALDECRFIGRSLSPRERLRPLVPSLGSLAPRRAPPPEVEP